MSVLEISVGLRNSTDEIIFLFAILLMILFYGLYKEYSEEVQNKELLDQFLNNQPPVS